MGLVYDTTSAQVVQVVKIGCKSGYHSHRGADEMRQLASYSDSTRSKLDQNSTRVSSTRNVN